MNLYSSRAARLLLIFFLGPYASCSVRAQHLVVVNATTNLLAGVVSRAGQADVAAQSHQQWPVVAGELVTNTVDGTNTLLWVPQSGHDYTVTVDHFGLTQMWDSTSYNVSFFWLGFTFTFCILLASWPVSWVRKMLADDWSSEA